MTAETIEHQIYCVADNRIAADFPPVERALADPDGLLAIGGDLSPARILGAYRRGIFPWYSEGQPILWWSPDPRCVIVPSQLKVRRSLRKAMRNRDFRVTCDRAFADVIQACAAPRDGVRDTWITREVNQAYQRLHDMGYGHSVECWQNGRLVGGLYGLAIGHIFFGESMFSRVSDASKTALVWLCEHLNEAGFALIDCQVDSGHLQRLGAELMPRHEFVACLDRWCEQPGPINWQTLDQT
ncbi:leucyl/phenylalanyl-tRNA--protein transferase [Methylohalomonas lacus]|uniref:Leucyl/phenylalanyl-tRNA--protein transferase n=1 Tax=Methylohalomonas lacus TaxID=398773 RepID=A0AAE3HI70_9GAMM|nr:leucyl/phenylalanyl-tRNA--protein transferase [Methylohalomonas lacus]MCS3902764.1 leucyl/phenylalanyl-tRNA--protein transferase [Methylohalomonas lacus]